MESTKQKELTSTLKEMEEVIRTKGYLPILYAQEFIELGAKVWRSFQDMEESRDKWRVKAKKLDNCPKCELCLEHSNDGRTHGN